MEDWESDNIVERWLRENDDTCMPLPDIESNPHLLISKVRKHYMEYLIKLLSVNFENNQNRHNENVYLPSAIWRCAKLIEMSAAQASMVVQLYRNSITNIVKELKLYTKQGLLYKNLYECLHNSHEYSKKTQTPLSAPNGCNCKCSCNQMRKVFKNDFQKIITNKKRHKRIDDTSLDASTETTVLSVSQTKPKVITDNNASNCSIQTNETNTLQRQDSDDLMQQLEKLFQGDPNDDDLFDGALCKTDTFKTVEEKGKSNIECQPSKSLETQPEIQEQKCLEDRLALLSGVLVNSEETLQEFNKENKKHQINKWLCEEYFQKIKFFEILDQIGDSNRNKLARIKELLIELFGADSDDEGIISPLEENPDFVTSCKERIAPWVVQILTPYYVKGRIRGKTLFKSLAKHLIRIIYQCSKYPCEYEVQSFVTDFLNNHKMIRCEADFKEFKIENF